MIVPGPIVGLDKALPHPAAAVGIDTREQALEAVVEAALGRKAQSSDERMQRLTAAQDVEEVSLAGGQDRRELLEVEGEPYADLRRERADAVGQGI
jgi:hypothetical protein